MTDEPRIEIVDGQEWLMAKCCFGAWHPYRKVIRLPQAAIDRWRLEERCLATDPWYTDIFKGMIMAGFFIAPVGFAAFLAAAVHPVDRLPYAPWFGFVAFLMGVTLLLVGIWLIDWRRGASGYSRKLKSIKQEILTEIGYGHLSPDQVGIYPEGPFRTYAILPSKD